MIRRSLKKTKVKPLSPKANIVKLEQKPKFPSIYRSFTELIHRTKRLVKVFYAIVVFLLALLVGVTAFDVYTLTQEKKQRELDREKAASELVFWENVTKRYPDYRDGYFKAAVFSYRLGENGKAKAYVEKALVLDPGFSEGRALEKMLSE